MKLISITVAAAALFSSYVAALPTTRPTLYVFGDSLSDIGLLNKLTLGYAARPPYWEGRFSSGPVWNEYLALLLKYNLYNKSLGGSTSDNAHSSLFPPPIQIPSTQDQINYFKFMHPMYQQGSTLGADVAFLEVGHNDFSAELDRLKSGELSIDSFITTLSDTVISQLEQMKQIGFKNILVTNLAEMQYTPMAEVYKFKSLARETIGKYNQMLASKANAWAESANLKSFLFVDIGGFVELTVHSKAIASALGLTDTTTSCIDGNTLNFARSNDKLAAFIKWVIDAKEAFMCSDPSTHYFFDLEHPAERIHRLFGYAGKELVTAALSGKTFEMNEANLLTLISKYNLGTPAPKPARI
ncbi:hypothetical protein GGI12_001430 [Dipsacomyces acuminosporus]|nr:hypothetical protein GGI12_001430 [Dipsacomyces acuminosporus]